MKKFKSLSLLITVLCSFLPAPLYCQWLEETIPVGDNPRPLVYNSTNNKVCCAKAESNSVTVIDGATDTVITTITVGGGPCTFAWNPIQNRVYVANYLSFTVSVIRDVTEIEERTTLDAKSFTPEIYPNPANSFLAVRLPLSADRQAIKMFDVTGKLIKEIATSASQSRNDVVAETKISLKGINPGIYFLRLGKETKKFLFVK